MPCSSTPAGTRLPWPWEEASWPPLVATTRARRGFANLGAPSHGLSTGCLRFALALTVPRTQDSLPATGQVYRVGLATHRVPTKGFRDAIVTSFPPFPSFLTQCHAGTHFLKP